MKKRRGPAHDALPMCGAHARSTGKPCRQLAMRNGRCYLHGGKSTGAKNPHRPIKNGLYTKKNIEEWKAIKEFVI